MALSLVTGGCGFIGSNLAHALVSEGEGNSRVRILDDLSTGRESNIATLRATHPDRVELWRGHVGDPSLLARALDGVDSVFHLAAIPSVPWSIERPLACDLVISHATLQLLEAVRRHNGAAPSARRIERVVVATSCAAYGDLLPEVPKREDQPVAPLSPYAAAKLACEQHCAVYARVFGVPTVALRFFNVFGPRQDPTSQYAAVIPNFIRAALAGQPPTVYGDGGQSRDFVFVDDVVGACRLARTAPAERVAGQVINIGSGQSATLREVLGALSAICGRRIEPRFAPGRAGEVRSSRADISRAQSLLGFTPRVSLEGGLRRTVEWFRAHEPAASGHPELHREDRSA